MNSTTRLYTFSHLLALNKFRVIILLRLNCIQVESRLRNWLLPPYRLSFVIINPWLLQWIEGEVMKKVGCRPPYWQRQHEVPDCTSTAQLQLLGKE
jgi:hypothetical protein